jgi:CubicO group peptidase (beta-lactamase class C family)
VAFRKGYYTVRISEMKQSPAGRIRQLLTHTSGLPEYDTMDDFVDRMASIPNALPDIEAFARGPLGFRPGTKWEYSNTNYMALGLVIAAVSSETYENYVHANLFAAAGMVRRVLRLVDTAKVKGAQIFVGTFTRVIAKTLHEAFIKPQIDPDGEEDDPVVSTLHSHAARLLRES